MGVNESRRYATVGLVALAVLVAGCSSLPFTGPTCGPGETAIEDVGGNDSSVQIKGELAEFNESSMIIDDGTGTADVLLLSDGVKDEVSPGDCIIARGPASEAENGSHDVTMVPTGLWEETYEVE